MNLKMDKYSVFGVLLDSDKIKNMEAGLNKIIVKMLKPVIKEEKTPGGLIIPITVTGNKDPRKLLKMGIVLKANATSFINEENKDFVKSIEKGDIVYINDLSGIHFDEDDGTYAIIRYEEILAYTKFDKLSDKDKLEIKEMIKTETEE